jgi:hypothetical protein
VNCSCARTLAAQRPRTTRTGTNRLNDIHDLQGVWAGGAILAAPAFISDNLDVRRSKKDAVLKKVLCFATV